MEEEILSAPVEVNCILSSQRMLTAFFLLLIKAMIGLACNWYIDKYSKNAFENLEVMMRRKIIISIDTCC